MKITSRGFTQEYGIAINYNPDYNDVSFQFWKWYFAVGRTPKPVVIEESVTEIHMKAFIDGKELGLDLPMWVVDEDFYEYLQEEGAEDSLELDTFAEYWVDWLEENTE